MGWWRLKQSVRLAEKAKKLLDDAGLAPNQVPLRTSIPLLEAASLEEDDELVDRWAALLANATGKTMDVPPSFANVLREIEPAAARLLDKTYERYMNLAPDLRPHFIVKIVETVLMRPEFEYHIDNLFRLGLLRHSALRTADVYDELTLTAFGVAFVKACQPPGTPDPPVIWTDRAALEEEIKKREAAEN